MSFDLIFPPEHREAIINATYLVACVACWEQLVGFDR